MAVEGGFVAGRELRQKVPRNDRMSSFRSRSGGNADKRAQPEEQIHSEGALLTASARFLFVVAITVTSMESPRSAHRTHRALLQHPQQLSLEVLLHVADLIEEDRAALRKFKESFFVRLRVGK
jgi:hypothetical protein